MDDARGTDLVAFRGQGVIVVGVGSPIRSDDAVGIVIVRDLSPGSSQLVDPKRTVGSMISTHTLPLKMFSEYIEQTTGASVRLLAIQPESIAFGTSLTDTLQ